VNKSAPGRHGDAVNGDRIFELATKTMTGTVPASVDILDGANHEARTDRNRESWRWWRAGLSGGVFRTTAEKHAGDLISSRMVPSDSSSVSAINVAPTKKVTIIVRKAAPRLNVCGLFMALELQKVILLITVRKWI
jgi:hypothetical protein